MIFALCLSLSVTGRGRLGIVGGYTSSKMSLASELSSIDLSSAPGFQAGLAFNQPLLLGFAIQPELVYSSKAASWEDTGSTKFGYLELPVQVQWGLDLIVAKPYLFVEPFVGYALSGSGYLQLPSLGEWKKQFDLNELSSRFEYGLGVGAGVMIVKHVQVAFKYFWNFDNCGLDQYLSKVTESIKTRQGFHGLNISVGIFF